MPRRAAVPVDLAALKLRDLKRLGVALARCPAGAAAAATSRASTAARRSFCRPGYLPRACASRAMSGCADCSPTFAAATALVDLPSAHTDVDTLRDLASAPAAVDLRRIAQDLANAETREMHAAARVDLGRGTSRWVTRRVRGATSARMPRCRRWSCKAPTQTLGTNVDVHDVGLRRGYREARGAQALRQMLGLS